MSSSYRKRPKHTSRSNSSQFPSAWSDWVYDEKRDRYQRYRLKGLDQYEYDYRQAQSNTAERERPRNTGPDSLNPLATGSYQESAEFYTTSNPPMGGLSLLANPAPAWTHVTTRDPNTNREEFDPHYKVQKPAQFRTGRIFKVLWSEPKGNGGYGSGNSSDSITVRSGKNGDSFEKVRRFVITNPMEGHCICLPIMTYGGQGVNKKGVHAGHHTVIYSSAYPEYLPGEDSRLNKIPLLVEPVSPRHKLDPASRLNYAKPYTVEYNVKVWFIGKLNDDSYWQMAADYNLVHPPLPTRPHQSSVQSLAPRDTFNYAMGGDGGTQSSYNTTPTTYTSAPFSGQGSYTQSDMPEIEDLKISQSAGDSGSSLHATSNPIPISSSGLSGGNRYLGDEDEITPLPGDFSSSLYHSGLKSRRHEELGEENFEVEQALAHEEVQFSQRAPQKENLGQNYGHEANFTTPANYKEHYTYPNQTTAPEYAASHSDYPGAAKDELIGQHDHQSHHHGNMHYPPRTHDEHFDSEEE